MYDVYTATKADRCESQLSVLLAAITMPQYQLASLSSLQHPIDTSGNNGKHHEIIDVTWHCIDLHIKPSARTPSNSLVNKILFPSTYTNSDGYTVSYYKLCSFLW